MSTFLSLFAALSSPPPATDGSTREAPGVQAHVVEHLGDRYRVVTVDLGRAALNLVGQDVEEPHTFAGVVEQDAIVAATNAGLFHEIDDPVGLWIQEGTTRSPLELGSGVGVR